MTGRTRRALLRTAGTSIAVGMAGCLGGDGQSSPTTEAEVIRETSFDGQYLVVELAPEHEVSKLNLIGPDGSAFAQTEVEAGETQAQLEILDIKEGLAGFEHYALGTHELVAVKEKPISRELAFQPDLRISGIDYYEGDENSTVTGRVSVTVENVGTAPTWIHDITYTGAPNDQANDSLAEDPGIPLIEKPETPDGLILEPGESRAFVGTSAPFVFRDESDPNCGGQTELSVIVGTAAGQSYEQSAEANIGGEVVSSPYSDAYACTQVSIEALRGDSDG